MVGLLDVFFLHKARNRCSTHRAFAFCDRTTVSRSLYLTIGDCPLRAALDTITFILHLKPPSLYLIDMVGCYCLQQSCTQNRSRTLVLFYTNFAILIHIFMNEFVKL